MNKLFFFAILVFFLAGCNSQRGPEFINEEASLPQSFGFNKMGLSVITSFINHNNHTMATLYGNSIAVSELNNTIHSEAGSQKHAENRERVLLLVTWSQKDDPYWFGAKVPDQLLSIESLKSTDVFSMRAKIRYQIYRGEGSRDRTGDKAGRINTILAMKPAVLL